MDRSRNASSTDNVADVLRNPRISDLALLAQEAIAEPDSMLLSPEYSPFSSIRDQDVETTITAACAKLSLRRDEIDDVGVATDYQIENLAWTSQTYVPVQIISRSTLTIQSIHIGCRNHALIWLHTTPFCAQCTSYATAVSSK